MKPTLVTTTLVLCAGCLLPANETVIGRLDAGQPVGTAGGSAGSTAGGAAAGGTTAGGNVGGGTVNAGVSCSVDGFCWEGVPFGGSFHAVHGTSASFVVAVGEGGVIATWNGTSLSYARPTKSTLRGVWFANAQLGWAVGDDSVILEWNGNSWSRIPIEGSKPFTAIHGSGDTVFIGGRDVVLTRRNGLWTELPGVLPVTDSNAIVAAIAVESSGSAWLVGAAGSFFFLHWDGQSWASAYSASGGGPSSSDQLYSATVCNGTLVVSGNYSGEFHSTWSRRNGTWSNHFSQGARSACLSEAEYLSFGGSYYSNSTIQLVPLDQRTPQNVGTWGGARAAFVASARDVFLVGAGGDFLHWTGMLASMPSRPVTQVFASSATNVLRRIGTDVVERLDGNGTWQPLTVPGSGAISDVYSAVEGDVWVLRQGPVAHHLLNGTWTSFSELATGTRFIRGAGAREVYFSGGTGVVSKWTGEELLTYFVPTQGTTGPVHLAGSDLWVPTMTMNGAGLTSRRVAGNWQTVTDVWAWRVTGSGSSIVFSTVQGLHRWSSGGISDITDSSGTELLASSSTDAFAASQVFTGNSQSSKFARIPLAGGAPTFLNLGTQEAITSLSATPDGHVWLTVSGGGLLHLRP